MMYKLTVVGILLSHELKTQGFADGLHEILEQFVQIAVA
jgi:hypothetical protein